MPVLPDFTTGYIRLFRKHALPDVSRTRVKLKVMESWIFNVLFANSPHHFGFSKSSKSTWTTHLQTIHPTVFRFFCKGWNSLSAGLVKQIVFPKKPSKKVFFFPSLQKEGAGGNSADLWPGRDGMASGGVSWFQDLWKTQEMEGFPQFSEWKHDVCHWIYAWWHHHGPGLTAHWTWKIWFGWPRQPDWGQFM